MIKNTLLILYRNQEKQKLVSLINIIGLAIALSCLILTIVFLKNELSYDRWNPNINKLYRLTRSYWSLDGSRSMHLGHISAPFAPFLMGSLPEIEKIGRIVQYETLLSADGPDRQNWLEKSVYMVDPEILELFSISFIAGNRQKALNEPFKIILSENSALKLFKGDSPIGKKVLLRDKFQLEVTGVYKPLPSNSHWHAAYLISFSTLNDNSVYGREYLDGEWESDSFATYLLANENLDISEFEAKVNIFIDKNLGSIVPNGFDKASQWTRLHLQRVRDIHLHSNLDSEFEPNAKISTLYLTGTIAGLILMMAVFNYVNISIAMSSSRLKEVGVKKILGALKPQLIRQFLMESVLFSILSLLLAFLIAILLQGWVISNIYPNITWLNILETLPIILFVTIAIALLAGIYPALLISFFKPVGIIKGQLGSSGGKFLIRKILTTIQFSVAITLIILTVHVAGQFDFLNNSELGYSKDNIVIIPNDYTLNKKSKYEEFYNTLVGSGHIKDLTRSSHIPTGRLIDIMDASAEIGDTLMPTKVKLKYVCIDNRFFDTYEIKFAEGRNFSSDIPTDIAEGFVLNEAAIKAIGWKTPQIALNKRINYGEIKGRVIGVVEDFHFESLHQVVSPTIFFISEQPFYGNISLKIVGNPTEAIQFIRDKWATLGTSYPFASQFLKNKYESLYQIEKIELKVFGFLTLISIVLSAIGLLGLTISSTNQKTKEIGIRKVHGARPINIIYFVTKEPFYLLLLSFSIAFASSWYILKLWLEAFPFKIQLQLDVFAVAAIFVSVLSIGIVIIQTWKVIHVNPARTLRNE